MLINVKSWYSDKVGNADIRKLFALVSGVVVVVVLVGAVIVRVPQWFAGAVGTNEAIEAENGTRTGDVVEKNDTSASGGKYIEFGPSTVPTNTPGTNPTNTPGTGPTNTPPPTGTGIRFINASTARSAKLRGSISVPMPSGYQSGDLLLATMQSDYAGNIGTPAGWTLINNDTNGQNYDLTARSFYKIASSSEPTSYTWNLINPDLDISNGGGAIVGGTLSIFRGVSTSNPIYAWIPNPETSGQFNQTCPSADAPAGGMLVCQFTHDDPPRINVNTNNTGLTEISFWRIPEDPNYNFDDSHETSYELRTVAGQTGTKTAYLENSTKDGNDYTLAIVLRPGGGSQVGLVATQPIGSTSCTRIIGPVDNVTTAVSGLNPGNTLCLRGGTYNQSVTINKSGTSTARITITNYNGENVVFQGGTFTVSDTSSLLNISGFTVKDASNYYAFGHFGEDNQISYITITGGSDAALLVRSSNRSEFSNLTVTNNAKSWGWSPTGCNPGVSGGWPSAISVKESSHIIIRDSDVGHNCGEGMNAWDKSSNITFANNLVHDNWSVEMYLDHSQGSTIENNLIYDTETSSLGNKNMPHGISIADESGRGWTTCTTTNNTIRNNIVINTKTGVSNFAYLGCGGLDNTRIENNTFANQWEHGLRFLGVNTNSQVRNNIVYGRPSADLLLVNNMAGLTISNNLFYGGNVVSFNQAGNLWGNPLFARMSGFAAADYALQAGSPGIGLGANPNTVGPGR